MEEKEKLKGKLKKENIKDVKESKKEKSYSKKDIIKYSVVSSIFALVIYIILMMLLNKYMYNTKFISGKKNIEDKNIEDKNISKELGITKEEGQKLKNTFNLLNEIIDRNFLYPDNRNKEKQMIGAIKGYIAGLGDEYTQYFTGEEFSEFLNDLDGKFVGIGVAMQKTEKGVELVKVFENSPAGKAGIKAGDVLVKVDGKMVQELNVEQIVNMVRGKEGTEVKISVLNKSGEKELNVKRENIKIRYVSGKILEDGIGYIKIEQFGDDAYKMFKEEYDKLINSGMKKLIIDLRGNTGGELRNAENIIEMFLGKDKLMYSTRNKTGYKVEERTRKSGNEEIKIIILGDRHSASASELLTGALVDNKRAKLVGENTFGKGVIQEMKPLPTGDFLKLTVQEYLRPNGDKIHKKGIKPDYEIKLDVKRYTEKKEDNQLEKALEVIKGD